MYLTAKAAMLDFSETLLGRMLAFAPEMQGLQAKECMFRIFRDIRFSRNKLPYKTNMGAYFAKGGRKSHFAGYYIHIQPGASFVAGGLWMPEPAILHQVRQEIYFRPDAFLGILKGKKFAALFKEVEGERLKYVPKAYDSQHPAAEWLKLKSFIVSYSFTDAELVQADFTSKVLEKMKAMKSWVEFLNQAIEMQE